MTSALTTAAAQGLAKNSLDGINSDDVEFSFLKGFHTAAIGAFIGYGVSSALGGSVSGSRISLGDAIGGAVGGAITGLLDQCLEPNSESEWSEDK